MWTLSAEIGYVFRLSMCMRMCIRACANINDPEKRVDKVSPHNGRLRDFNYYLDDMFKPNAAEYDVY